MTRFSSIIFLARAVIARITRILRERSRVLSAALVGFLLVIGASYSSWISAPSQFPENTLVTISAGASFADVAADFQQKGLVRSTAALRGFVELFGGDERIRAGDYYFDEAYNVVAVAHAITTGDFGIKPTRVLIPEGSSAQEIARILSEASPAFDSDQFLATAEDLEGYLFPDTYFFLPTLTSKEAVSVLHTTFFERIRDIQPVINESPYSLPEIVTMASLLEKEASDYQTKRRIAGVLWRRFEIGMPLQVDAVFPYILGKNTYEVTLEDLQVDSPYNTYRYAGLPPGPIANPSLDSIKAAVDPVNSDYLYYLADRSGNTYFSETFEEHREKKRIYVN